MGKTAAVAGSLALPALIPASARAADGQVAPSNRITLAQIGCGVMGRGHTRRLANDPSVELLAVCDVDRSRVTAAREMVAEATADRKSRCMAYNDYREVMARDDIDGVVIVTPDHWHAPLAIAAAASGKDVYCEKPVSVFLEEGRQLVDAVQRYDRVFQNGSQYRSNPKIRRVCEFVRAGGLGKIKAVFTRWGSGPSDVYLAGEPVPEGLDWEMWGGPALWRPYNARYHRNPMPGVVPWVFSEDFGVGPSTSYHSHSTDVVHYAVGLEESGPVEILHPNSGAFPTLTFRFANGILHHLVESWDQVQSLYRAVPDDARLDGMFGGIIVGERGWVTSMSRAEITGGPADMMAEMSAADLPVNISGGDHHGNWLECMRTRGKPSSHAEIGHRAASLGHLIIIAKNKLKRSLKWDPVKEIFPDDDQANRLLRRARRAPWHL
jgi:predicted dehydrogenase